MIFSLFSITGKGWILALMLLWGLVEFIFVVIGAIVTYIKAVVGLAFLFGIAPIFFLFLLFEKTRPIFFGWMNQVAGFAVQPVLLFAFLAFYVKLIDSTLDSLLVVNYCYVKWFSLPGGLMDIYFWRPTIKNAQGLEEAVSGDYGLASPPISMIDILYFLALCHLAKQFTGLIETIARDLVSGSGPGITKGGDVGNWFKNNLTGGRGRASLTGLNWAGGKLAAGAVGLGSILRPGVGKAANDSNSTSKGETSKPKGYMGQKLDQLKDAAGYRGDSIRQGVNAKLDPVRNKLNDAAAAVRDTTQTVFRPVTNTISAVKEQANKVSSAVGDARDAVTGAVGAVRDTVGQKLSVVTDAVQNVHDAVEGKVIMTKEAIEGQVNRAKNAVNDVRTAVEGKVDAVQSAAINAATSRIDNAVNNISNRIAGSENWKDS